MCVFVCVCVRSEEHTSELQSHLNIVCRLLLVKKKHNSASQSHFVLLCVVCVVQEEPLSSCGQRRCSPLTRPSLAASFLIRWLCFFFFNDTATTEIYTLSLHDALPI